MPVPAPAAMPMAGVGRQRAPMSHSSAVLLVPVTAALP
jgi:hypothetical protein